MKYDANVLTNDLSFLNMRAKCQDIRAQYFALYIVSINPSGLSDVLTSCFTSN